MNTSTQEFTDSGMPDAMPIGSMLSDAGSGMPAGDMNAAPQGPAFAAGPTDEMPAGTMMPTGQEEMPAGAMLQAAAQEMPAAEAEGPGYESVAEMPIGGMLDTGSGGMPMGAMLSAAGSGESWNMDVVSPEQACGSC